MDPTTCYKNMVLHLREGRLLDAAESAENLYDWLKRGGFRPAGVGLSGAALQELCHALFTGVEIDNNNNREDG